MTKPGAENRIKAAAEFFCERLLQSKLYDGVCYVTAPHGHWRIFQNRLLKWDGTHFRTRSVIEFPRSGNEGFRACVFPDKQLGQHLQSSTDRVRRFGSCRGTSRRAPRQQPCPLRRLGPRVRLRDHSPLTQGHVAAGHDRASAVAPQDGLLRARTDVVAAKRVGDCATSPEDARAHCPGPEGWGGVGVPVVRTRGWAGVGGVWGMDRGAGRA
ncbi:hypothetical protein GCM10020254_30770 [Streptomyces goshikiensis]